MSLMYNSFFLVACIGVISCFIVMFGISVCLSPKNCYLDDI